MRITVCTVAYNGYGQFIQQWIERVRAQAYPAHEVIIVLGHEHGLTGYSDAGKVIIHHDHPVTMGFLRNLAIDAATGDYIFFFAADDILLPNALQEISDVDADIIALKYLLNGEVRVTPEVVAKNIKEWRPRYTGPSGFMAFKNGLGLRCENTDWPHYPFLFQAYKRGLTFKTTKEVGAVYVKRPGSHGSRAENNRQGLKEIKKYLLQYGLITQ